MAINPKIINPNTDAEIYANACPTLGTLMLARYSTPLKHDVMYSVDIAYFGDHPGERSYLRRQFPGEFDVFTDFENFKRVPELWILVTDMGGGYHERTPRWRGKRFWKDIETCIQMATVLIQFAEKDAISLSEWYGYVSDQRIEDADARRKAN